MNQKPQRICQACGQMFYGSRDCHYCPTCAKERKRDTVVRLRTCKDCGNSFYGGPRAMRCPNCAHKASLERQKKYRESGYKRPLGSVDKCIRCGKDYIVVSGRQKYCPDCKTEAVLEWQRENKKEYHKLSGQDIKKQERRKAQKTICVYCQRAFKTDRSTDLCSDYCRKEHKKLYQCIADIKRGEKRNLQKYLDKREAYREQVKTLPNEV